MRKCRTAQTKQLALPPARILRASLTTLCRLFCRLSVPHPCPSRSPASEKAFPSRSHLFPSPWQSHPLMFFSTYTVCKACVELARFRSASGSILLSSCFNAQFSSESKNARAFLVKSGLTRERSEAVDDSFADNKSG